MAALCSARMRQPALAASFTGYNSPSPSSLTFLASSCQSGPRQQRHEGVRACAWGHSTHSDRVLGRKGEARTLSALAPSLSWANRQRGTSLNGRRDIQWARTRPQPAGRSTCHCSLAPPGSEVAVAAALFTLSTAAVVPLYTLMLLAPDRPMTKRVMRSNIPWIILGSIYLYLLALSWTPLTLPSMFSSKYWLPELPAITHMFSSTLTVASAWVHLLGLDLYAARSVYFEGLALNLEFRHSICLCLLFAPVGILCHAITKAIVSTWRSVQGEANDKAKLSDVALD